MLAEDAVTFVKNVKAIGQTRYEAFVEERLVKCSVPITNIIPKNTVHLYKKASQQGPTRTSHQITSLKRNCDLFARIYISCQSRSGDIDDFLNTKTKLSHQLYLIWES